MIPNKMYFRIGEVADLLGVKPYVLRYWETEFPDIKPAKSKSSQRLYKRKDVETLMVIKKLLYDEKFTINGAREHLRKAIRGGKIEAEPVLAPTSTPSVSAKTTSGGVKKMLAKIKSDLQWCAEEIRK